MEAAGAGQLTHHLANPVDPPRTVKGFATTVIVLLIILAVHPRGLFPKTREA